LLLLHAKFHFRFSRRLTFAWFKNVRAQHYEDIADFVPEFRHACTTMVLPAVDVEPTQPQLLELRAAGMSTFYLSRSNDTLLLTQIERVLEVNDLQVVSTEVVEPNETA
jgi:hypothetical protein